MTMHLPPRVENVWPPTKADVQPRRFRGRWVIMAFSHLTRRWDRFLDVAFKTEREARYYSRGKFAVGSDIRAVRVTRAGRISQIVNPLRHRMGIV